MRVRLLAPLTGVLFVSVGTRTATAGPTATELTAAEALFQEAKSLAEGQRWADACPKLEESQRLAPHMVTLYRLADCYEHIGRTASAWALFLDAASRAREAGEVDREKVARSRAAALETRLTRLGILSETLGAHITRDGVPVGPQQLGTSLPVDPGPHTIVATAPGKKLFSTVVTVSGAGSSVTVTVPPLEDEPALETSEVTAGSMGLVTEQTNPTVHTSSSSNNASHLGLAGAIIFGVGAATAVSAGVLFLAGPSETATSCPVAKCTLPGVLLISGITLSVTGGAIWLADFASRPRQAVTVSLGPTRAALRVAF
jgi:hypothetical protein